MSGVSRLKFHLPETHLDLLMDERSLPFKVRRRKGWSRCGCIRNGRESKVIPNCVLVKLVPLPLSIRQVYTARPKRGACLGGKRPVKDRGIVEGRYVMTNKTVARGVEMELMHKGPIRIILYLPSLPLPSPYLLYTLFHPSPFPLWSS
jgi:hypothetical protein